MGSSSPAANQGRSRANGLSPPDAGQQRAPGPFYSAPHDNDLINRAAYLFSSGVWHVHSQDAEGSDATESTGPWKRVPGTPSAQSRRRQSWHLKTRYRNCQVIRAADLTAGDEYLENPASIRLEILGWAQDPQAQATLAEIHAAISGGRMADPARPQLNWLAQQVESAFRSRTLVLVRETRRNSSGTLEQPAADSTTTARDKSTKAAPEKTWFRMQLLDEDGDLMPGEDYVVTDSAGVRRQGKLDSNSELYIPPILPIGTCTITFPNIHLNPRKRK